MQSVWCGKARTPLFPGGIVRKFIYRSTNCYVSYDDSSGTAAEAEAATTGSKPARREASQPEADVMPR